MKTFSTPDRDITPPDEDDRFEDCIECGGHGFYFEVEPDEEDPTLGVEQKWTCNRCKGTGKTERDDD